MKVQNVLWVVFLIAVISLLWYSSNTTKRTNLIVGGAPAPEIVGEDIDGQAMKLTDFRGKVVFLDFWGNW